MGVTDRKDRRERECVCVCVCVCEMNDILSHYLALLGFTGPGTTWANRMNERIEFWPRFCTVRLHWSWANLGYFYELWYEFWYVYVQDDCSTCWPAVHCTIIVLGLSLDIILFESDTQTVPLIYRKKSGKCTDRIMPSILCRPFYPDNFMPTFYSDLFVSVFYAALCAL